MKKLCLTLIVGYVLLFGTIACFLALGSGCASTSTAPAAPTDHTKSAKAVRITTQVGVSLTLGNNPKYESAAQCIVAGIDLVTTGDIVFTEDVIVNYVAKRCHEAGLTAQESMGYISLARSVYQAFKDDHPDLDLSRVQISNPDVKLYVGAFRDGIVDALLNLQAVRNASGS